MLYRIEVETVNSFIATVEKLEHRLNETQTSEELLFLLTQVQLKTELKKGPENSDITVVTAKENLADVEKQPSEETRSAQQ